MAYKVITQGQIVDVVLFPSYVRRQRRNGIFVSCGADLADGVISSTGRDIYLLPGAEPVEGCPAISLVEITEAEYEDLRQRLTEGGMLEDLESESQTSEASSPGPQESGAGGSMPPTRVAVSPILRRLEEQEREIELLREQVSKLLAQDGGDASV